MSDLIVKYEKLIERLENANMWLIQNNIDDIEEVKHKLPKRYSSYVGILKDIEGIKNLMYSKNLIKYK